MPNYLIIVSFKNNKKKKSHLIFFLHYVPHKKNKKINKQNRQNKININEFLCRRLTSLYELHFSIFFNK